MTQLPRGVPVRLRVDTSAFAKIAEEFADMSEAASEETTGALLEVAMYLEREVAFGTPVDRGFLRDGLTSGVDQSAPHLAEAFVGVQGVAIPYARPIESGFKHFPPMDALMAWVRRKQFNWTDKRGRPLSVRSMAYLVGRKLATVGYEGAHMARNAVERGDAQINQIVERRFAAFVERYFR